MEKLHNLEDTNDLLHSLKHDLATGRYSHRREIVTYLTDLEHTSTFSEEMNVDNEVIHILTPGEQIFSRNSLLFPHKLSDLRISLTRYRPL